MKNEKYEVFADHDSKNPFQTIVFAGSPIQLLIPCLFFF